MSEKLPRVTANEIIKIVDAGISVDEFKKMMKK